jgi:monoamine oxidase
MSHPSLSSASSSASSSSGADVRGAVLYDCCVIGAGLSGLSAAAFLQSHGARVCVLEARTRTGGRTFTTAEGVDLGGAYIGPTQNRILRVARDLKVSTSKVRTEGISVLQLQGKRSTYSGLIPSVGPLALLDVNYLLTETDRLAAMVDPKEPWKSKLAELDQRTVAEWLETHAQTSQARTLYENTVKALVTKPPAEVSMLYW